MVLITNLKIFHLFIFGKIREENVFDDILERKKAFKFLNYKKQKVKKVKKWDFYKGVNPFAPGDFAEKRVLKLVEWFSGHCRATKRSEERRVAKECQSRWSPYH